MVTWQEQNGTSVSQVHDYEKGIIYSNWTSSGGEFSHAKGTITLIYIYNYLRG
ncbi:hypothetical protein NAF19_07050 [Mucilaginibacter sp. RT5R15]|nr:hypothetical protein [Mucilaginibacter flavidus]MCO5946641.1 hypothetical protein [Mucilaginibacter flavidus]